jgi:hypothetical protein
MTNRKMTKPTHPLATLCDQQAERPPLVNGAKATYQQETTFYFAGKIAKNDWRHDLVHDFREDTFFNDDLAFRERPILQNALGNGLHYSGPHFNSCDHGCAHGPNQHGVFGCCLDVLVPPHSHVSSAALLQIQRSDVLFAWLDDVTCYGTLVEIGIARALHKMIWIGWAVGMATVKEGDPCAPRDNLWFANSLADYNCVADSATQAFRYFLSKPRHHYRF